MNEPMRIEKPLVLIFEHGGKLVTHLYPRQQDTHESYGLIVCDLVRHAARAFNVEEDDVWEWVEKEWRHPTTDIDRAS